MSQSTMPNDPGKEPGGTSERIIKVIQTPLGLFALVVLVVEALLGILALSDPEVRRLSIIGMFIFMGFLVAVVATLAYEAQSQLGSRQLPRLLRYVSLRIAM